MLIPGGDDLRSKRTQLYSSIAATAASGGEGGQVTSCQKVTSVHALFLPL